MLEVNAAAENWMKLSAIDIRANIRGRRRRQGLAPLVGAHELLISVRFRN